MAAGAPLRVLIAGGGVAGVECVLALRALAGEHVSISMLAPEPALVYRPLSVLEPFQDVEPHRWPLARLAADCDVDLVEDALSWVAPDAHAAFATSGESYYYDVLLLALGADRVPALDNAITFRGGEDAEPLRLLLDGIAAGTVGSVAFVAPSGSWTLPLYELALMTAERAREGNGNGARITLVSTEARPLEIFGPEASDEVAALLDDAAIEFLGSAQPVVTRPGEVAARPGVDPLTVDAVVALPVIAARRVRGIPADPDGFVPVTPFGRVLGVKDVFAAGDGTTFPIKQGGVACQQADVVAEVIARRAGIPITPTGYRPVLRGLLLTGSDPLYLRHEQPRHAEPASAASSHTLWWPPSKVAGKYLAPYLGEPQGGMLDPGLRRRAVITTARAEGGTELMALRQPSRAPAAAAPVDNDAEVPT